MKSEVFECFNFPSNKDGKQDKRQPCVHCNYLKMFINELFFFYNEKFEPTIISR